MQLGYLPRQFTRQGGFRLSLRGQDPELDFDAIAMELGGRRIDPVESAQSLILTKHRTDRPPGWDCVSPRIRSSLMCFAGGLSKELVVPSEQSSPSLVRSVSNPKRLGSNSQLQNTAHHIRDLVDGSVSDVTPWVRYECSSLDGASVDAMGKVSATRPIDTSISGMYLGRIGLEPLDLFAQTHFTIR